MRPIVSLFILFAILIKPQLSLAEDIFLYFGGGSPIIKDDTMFDYSAKNIISYLKKHPNWKSKLYYRAGNLDNFSKAEQAQFTTLTKRLYGAPYSDDSVARRKLDELIISSREITADERLLYQ